MYKHLTMTIIHLRLYMNIVIIIIYHLYLVVLNVKYEIVFH